MGTDRRAQADALLKAYRVLAGVFLELPDAALVERLLRLPADAFGPGAAGAELAAFARDNAARPVEEVLLEVARDRAVLVRGAGGQGFRPPYESLYLGGEANASIAALNRFYAAHGFERTGEVKDASDQIGVEFAFAAALLEREVAALDAGDTGAADEAAQARAAFLREHLGRWAASYAREMLACANTRYYRGVALLIEKIAAIGA